jgi:hypothetical protein
VLALENVSGFIQHVAYFIINVVRPVHMRVFVVIERCPLGDGFLMFTSKLMRKKGWKNFVVLGFVVVALNGFWG